MKTHKKFCWSISVLCSCCLWCDHCHVIYSWGLSLKSVLSLWSIESWGHLLISQLSSSWCEHTDKNEFLYIITSGIPLVGMFPKAVYWCFGLSPWHKKSFILLTVYAFNIWSFPNLECSNGLTFVLDAFLLGWPYSYGMLLSSWK